MMPVDISDEVHNSLDGERKLTLMFCGEKKMTVPAVALPCFSLLPHTVEVINAAADKPDWNVSFCY